MATLLLPPGRTTEEPAVVGEATLVFVLSPVPSRDGHLRVERRSIPAGRTVAASLPHQPWPQVVWNGAVVPPEGREMVVLQPGDELWCYPAWGEPVTASLLITFAVGIAISVATTALSYVLFPPSKPHVEAPDPHTFSFEGIRTAVGPGSIVPVIYGTHRHGGQLLSASVEQNLTVISTSSSATRLTANTNPPTLTMILDFGEGPISGFLLDTLEINGQPASNYQNIQVDTRLGTATDAPLTGYDETRNTHADGRDLPDNSSNTGQEIVYTTSVPVIAFIVNVVFNQGLYNFTGSGEKEDNEVNVAYRYRVHPAGAWSAYGVFQVNAQRTAPVRFGIRHEGLASAVYDIAVNFGGIRHNNETRAKWQPTLESVTEITPGGIPNRNTARLALRAVATDQLQGQLPNVTCVVRGRTVRVATFNPTETWSDNPAWCVMDALTNTRYGDGIPDTQIDLNAFYAWATYCDEVEAGEPRHRFNYVLEREGRVQSLLLEMMGGSRTLMLKAEGAWTPHPTRDETPTALFSWSSVSNVKVTYTRDPERVNVIEARFANEEDGYQQDVITWPTVDNWPLEVHKASLELRGVTKPSRVMRALQFELNRRHYETVQVEFDCSLEAATLQIHDLFRFSHPMPGWGTSGRIMPGSTQDTLHLDEDVTMVSGVTYHVYLRYINDVTEARVVYNPAGTTTRTLQFGVPFSFTPQPYDTLWAFGTASPDNAVRTFRCTKLQRRGDTTAHIEGVIHNASIYTEGVASPTPGTPGLFNPLGPPPPLTTLVATELTRVQPSGASMRVVNLAWDVAPLGPGFAPYGGAKIFRRTVLLSGAGTITAGAMDFGAIGDPNDPNYNFVPLVQVTGHVLETDDFTVVQGSSYLYRVVPISGRGVPNVNGSLDALINVAGPTTPDYYPGTPRNLRVFGKAVGVLTWEGRDCNIQWDTVADSPLFSATFFVQDYIVQTWAPGMPYIMRSEATTALNYKYTLAMNTEDQARNGFTGARRDLFFRVYARTNTGRISLDPAQATFTNPPPDMSMIEPDVGSLGGTGIISWNQYLEPSDFDHYELHLDLMNPPVAIYQDIAVSFHGTQFQTRKVFAQGLTVGAVYYTFVMPYDTFGPGIQSATASFQAAGITAASIDSTPPAAPTGLHLTTGTETMPDGTIQTWVEASWDRAPESDVAGYEVHVFTGTNAVPTVWNPERDQHTIRFYVPGNTTVKVQLLTFDKFHNLSPYSGFAEITTGKDTTPPAAPINLTAFGSIRSVRLMWTPPPDADYDHCEIWSSASNNLNAAGQTAAGTGRTTFIHEGLGPDETRYYWIRAVDTSGNHSVYHPLSATAGVAGTAGKLDYTFIERLLADQIFAGNLNAFIKIGVANQITLDGVNQQIGIWETPTGGLRVLLGKLGSLSSDWGMRIFNHAGQVMWNLTDGAQTPGISDAAVTAAKIQAGSINAAHLITDTAVITFAAQIANAIIDDAKITTLAIEKVLTGNMAAFWTIGAGNNMILDGVNQNIQVWDANTTLRVLLGRLGPLNQDYGLNIWDQFGNLMWALNGGGAQTPGIAPASVITTRIAPNAVTAAIAFSDFGSGGLPNFESETVVATLSFPEVLAGDQVMVSGKVNLTLGNLGADREVTVTLREDGLGGGAHDQGRALLITNGGSFFAGQEVYAQAVANIGFYSTNKTFVLTVYHSGGQYLTFQGAHLMGLRTQR